MNENVGALLPELSLLIGSAVTLLVGIFSPQRRQWTARLVAVVALLVCLATGLVALTGPGQLIFSETWAVDGPLGGARVIVAAAGLLTIALSIDSVGGSARETEFYTLLLLASLGSLVLAGSSDLLVLAVGYLLTSVPLYALVGLARDPSGAEAALKTYLLGALLGVVMLLGVTVLFGIGGATTYRELNASLGDAPRAALAFGLVALLAGLLFKAGGVPAHFWIPDAVEGAGIGAAAFATTIPKVGALIATYRVLTVLPESVVDWPLLVGLLAALSMTLGNLAAFGQTSVRRLLGYSTISQVGYLLMAVAVAGRDPLAARALVFYLAAYAVTNLAAFAVVAELPRARALRDYQGLARRRPLLAGALVISLLGLVGTPPAAVFVGKVSVFTAAWGGGLAWLSVVAAVNTVASLFYYLRWLAPVFSVGVGSPDSAGDPGVDPAPLQAAAGTWGRVAALSGAAASVVLGLAAGPAIALLDAPLLR